MTGPRANFARLTHRSFASTVPPERPPPVGLIRWFFSASQLASRAGDENATQAALRSVFTRTPRQQARNTGFGHFGSISVYRNAHVDSVVVDTPWRRSCRGCGLLRLSRGQTWFPQDGQRHHPGLVDFFHAFSFASFPGRVAGGGRMCPILCYQVMGVCRGIGAAIGRPRACR